MLTVIIPALNEEKTIGSVVRFCFNCSNVSEVIVVDEFVDEDSLAIMESWQHRSAFNLDGLDDKHHDQACNHQSENQIA